MGAVSSKARIRTTSDPEHPIDVDVAAVRSGDIRFLPPIPIVGGGIWSSTSTLLNLGIFEHKQGSKVVMPALVSAMKGNFQVLGVESEVDFLKISDKRDRKIGRTNGRACGL